MTNTPERTIVVGLDNTPGARAALQWAVRHASRARAAVRAVHFLDLPGSAGSLEHDRAGERASIQSRALDWATRALTGLHADVPVTIEMEEGNPATVLSRAARHADVLVLGMNRDSTQSPLAECAVPTRCELVIVDEAGQAIARQAAVEAGR